MLISYKIVLTVTVDRDAVPLTKQAVVDFFANPAPIPANWTVSGIEVKHTEIE